MSLWHELQPKVVACLTSVWVWGVGGFVALAVLSPAPRTMMGSDSADGEVAGASNPNVIMPDREMTALECTTCHHIDYPDLSHPLGVVAPSHMPSYMPTDSGRISCITCHETSVSAHGRSRQVHDGLLRGPLNGRSFCTNCHISTSDQQSAHALALGRAHLNWAGRTAATAVVTASDMGTRTCVSCHDGSTGKSIGNSHPVAVPYRKKLAGYRSATSRRRLTPVDRLDPRIRLFDGNVGCASCHSPYSSLPDQLVMPNPKSELCKSCHQGY